MIEPDGSPAVAKIGAREFFVTTEIPQERPTSPATPRSELPSSFSTPEPTEPDSALVELGSSGSEPHILSDLAPPPFNGNGNAGALTHSVLSRVARMRNQAEIFPSTFDQAVDRVLAVREAARGGLLYEDAIQLGVDPVWVAQLLQEPVRVAISEQVMPLTTLFAKLGSYGSPAAMARAFATMSELANRLEAADPEIGVVKVGQITSIDHGVTFKDITSGFHFLVPLLAPGVDQESIQGRHLFSGKDKKRFNGAGYRDLSVAVGKVEEVLEAIDHVYQFAHKEGLKNVDAAERQRAFNIESRERNFPVTEEQAGRVESALRRGARFLDTAAAANAFLEDCAGALRDSGGLGPDRAERVDYCQFISHLNARLAQRFLGDRVFETAHTEHVNSLPCFGIKDWGTFLGKFFKAGIFHADEPVLRWRVDEPGRDIDYRSLAVVENNGHGIVLADRFSKTQYRLDDLVERSRESVLAGGPPLLIPIASMRYWVNYAMTSSISMDDGMPYDKIQRLQRAMQDPKFTLMPRDLTIVPYTRLNTFTPSNPSDPYQDLKPPRHDVLDYYRFAGIISKP